MQNITAYVVGALVLIVVGCNDTPQKPANPKGESTNSAQQTTALQQVNVPVLKLSVDDFNRLNNQTTGAAQNKKLVFQFVISNATSIYENLSLAAYMESGSPVNPVQTGLKVVLPAHNGQTVALTPPDSLYLGTLRSYRNGNNGSVKELERLFTTQNMAYITLTPELSTRYPKNIVYKLKGYKADGTEMFGDLEKIAIPYNELHPSPPARPEDL
ncbi:MAG TPA: hypothetical protein PKD90_02085 [Phnomibacter sp.]|nr:hypothetical protein [Phnomibacter sp.]